MLTATDSSEYRVINCFYNERIRKTSVVDPDLLPGSVSGNIVPDPDPAKYERADK